MTDNISITPLFTEEIIADRTQQLANEIAHTYPKDLLVVALLRGSFMFAADLLRALHRAGAHPQVDFMTASSYGTGKESSGQLTIYRDLTENVHGRNVLIVDDILETGRTLSYAHAEILNRGANMLHICVLLEKPGKCITGIKADFVGFEVPDQFVVGYGLDHANYWRELPFIGVLPQ